MGEGLKVYNLVAGVNLAKPELQLEPNELRQGQNAVFAFDEGHGRLDTRAGMARFTTSAMSGAVIGFVNVALADLR